MKKGINIFFIASVSIFILTSCNNSGGNNLSKKELELEEKKLTSKGQGSTKSETDIQEAAPKAPIQETKKIPDDTKILTLMSPTYVVGDLEHLLFKDFTTHKEEEYECNWELPAIKEIVTKCEDHDGCPALKGRVYIATLKLKLLDEVEYAGANEGMKPTGKKEKRWVIIALEKK